MPTIKRLLCVALLTTFSLVAPAKTPTVAKPAAAAHNLSKPKTGLASKTQQAKPKAKPKTKAKLHTVAHGVKKPAANKKTNLVRAKSGKKKPVKHTTALKGKHTISDKK